VTSVYDRRMAEIARQREADRDDRTGLDRIAESTDTINAGMANPLVWILSIGSILFCPVTGGMSIGLLIAALLIATAGGRACAQAIAPTAADLAAPGPGCVRIAAALGVLVLSLIVIALFFAVLAYNLGVKQP